MTSPADSIVEAFESKHLIEPLTDTNPGLDEAAAYAVARDVHARRLLCGERPVGRKIGFTNRTIWAKYGVWAPIWGHVYDATLRYSESANARLAIDHLLQPRIEPEIELHFARTHRSHGTIRRSSKALTGSPWGTRSSSAPFPDWRFRAPDAIAAYALHGALLVGTPVAMSQIADCPARLRALTVSLARTGEGAGCRKRGGCARQPRSGARAPAGPGRSARRRTGIGGGDREYRHAYATPASGPGEIRTAKVEGINLPDLSITLV